MSVVTASVKSTCSYPPKISMLSTSSFIANSLRRAPTTDAMYLTISVLPELEAPARIKGRLCLTHRRAASMIL
ncbi:hypothetical protein CANTEDRAFT_109611 [Yamadazyma tenuis ATCC 10573]|uniref:Uncharacterized protein n=1 Tax=Candida tenuis (strain ATCC 10573 / BCRC 21748 / CBS 615 / JCM 9827 / NBRC 10315 / NRRL Y-1498 / VKM Y-70) TaxID=590646 RepID=G3BAL6_CANTC|nr:uncharacterized protein CANTEDRAFT_109611 [Yamadazyma tenuis ATCC 10573]EGV61434.1 hypothetical protein CANTEDRAFT_109611 [Yamadazyma tenuis ATCC 10573]